MLQCFCENTQTCLPKENMIWAAPTASSIPPRRVPLHCKDEFDCELNSMLKRNIVEPSTSPWGAGVVIVIKKDGKLRFCVDNRGLNSVTRQDAYPLPRVDDSLDALGGAAWFSTVDLMSGYWQVEVHPDDRPKTVFVTRRELFQFNVLPFGLCNAPATFERVMESVLARLQYETCLVYLDDIIIFGSTFDHLLDRMGGVFDRLMEAGFKLKPKKCSLFAREVSFLGHTVSEKGIATDPEKIRAVQ